MTPVGSQDANQACFLQSLAQTGNLSLACHAASLTRRQVKKMRQEDAAFDLACDDALDDAADRLEAEAWRRALEGVSQPILVGGRPALDPQTNEPILLRRYSDPLLVMLLKGCKPDKYQKRGQPAPPVDPLTFIKEIAADDDPPRATRKRP